MGKIKLFFWILCVGALATASAYFYSQKSTSLLAQKLKQLQATIHPLIEKTTPFTEEVSLPTDEINFEEVSTLTQRGKELTEHVGAVLGESVTEVDAEKQPLHERAVEYGQYLYCKGIVEEYENNHDTTSPSD